MKFLKTTLAATILAVTATSANADTYRLNDTYSSYTNGSWVFSSLFTVGTSNVTVTDLGAFDADGDGFVTSGGIQVGIYDELTQSLLASTNVLSSDVMDGNYRYSDVSDIVLTAGDSYRLVAVSGSDYYDTDNNDVYNSAFTFDSYGYVSGSSLEYTTQFSFTEYDYGMGNFKFTVSAVPEPSTYVLMLGGLGLVGFMAARRRKA